MTETLPTPVDTLHTVETPEGALLQLTVAGPVVRAMAVERGRCDTPVVTGGNLYCFPVVHWLPMTVSL